MKATEIKLTIEGKWRCVICCQKWRSHKQLFAFVIYVELPNERRESGMPQTLLEM